MRASSLRRSTRLTSSAICRRLGRGRRSSRVNTCRTCDTVRAGLFFPLSLSLERHKPQRQQRQRHVVVPAHPTAHLVLSQAALARGSFKTCFHRLALTGHRYHLRQGGGGGSIHAVVGARVRRPDVPAHQQPVAPAALIELKPMQRQS